MCPAAIVPELPGSVLGQSMASKFSHLRGVRWRIDLGVLPSSPSSTIDDLRRVTADSRRRYASLRKQLLIDPHVCKFGNDCQDLAIDNPLSQDPDFKMNFKGTRVQIGTGIIFKCKYDYSLKMWNCQFAAKVTLMRSGVYTTEEKMTPFILHFSIKINKALALVALRLKLRRAEVHASRHLKDSPRLASPTLPSGFVPWPRGVVALHSELNSNECPLIICATMLSIFADSMWGRFFLNAELEQTVDKDLSRLYPEHESYFQTPGCQGMLRRILLLWCLRHPECGYRQGMHELLAPLLYVLHADLRHFNEIRKIYEDHFVDKFDESLFHENHDFSFKISSNSSEDDDSFQEQPRKHTNLSDLDANVQSIVLLSDPYGAEGELGVVLSERFMEHDAYCMFDALMSGAGGAVAMAVFFSHTPASGTHTCLAPVIEASLTLYHLLSIVDSSLYSHLVELGVEPQYFALRWLRVLFGREFSLEDLLVVWDEIFSFDNSKTVKAGEQDPGILNSPRGAFISAMAVSMMLHVRSSLLATEYATSCLQRLLNFPEKVDLEKLIEKAKSLVTLAIEANVPSHSTPLIEHGSSNKQMSMKGHSLSFDSNSPQTPIGVIPERYWEEKWRVLQEKEETKKKNSPNQASSKRKGWTEKIKMRLSRSESEPCPLKRGGRDRNHKSSVRRSLLEDLARQLNADEDAEEVGQNKSSSLSDPLCIGSDVTVKDVVVERMSYIDKICSAQSTASEDFAQQLNADEDAEQIGHDESSQRDLLYNGPDVAVKAVVAESMSCVDKICSARSSTSEEHSPAFSEPASPSENDTERSSTESNLSHDMMDGETQNSSSFASAVDEPPPISDTPEANSYGVPGNNDISGEVPVTLSNDANPNGVSGPDNIPKEPLRTIFREWKALSGKFQWFFKFGRHNSGEGTSDRTLQIEDAKSADGGSLQGNKVRLSADEANCNPRNVKADGCDQNLASTLRNLGQSMLENIQVLESAFQQDKNQVGPIDHLSKHALVEKGQVTAMAALTELRKISNLLREM
ncbi:hypothetical protein Cgig2_028118 [Carnegiea gigantea]|uniref:Rab-GAP TBC domain-containing protein n=1 Tax=Carnegiea gigantea TaxID=171969 RepID=A0A9Q1QJ75_9CARY|nr:hypothetical protein Cgig2_028118 [Carnegiea gigantea]